MRRNLSDDDACATRFPIPAYMNLVFATISGTLSICLTQPAEVLKTRKQLVNPAFTLGLTGIIWGIIKENGYRGFFKGLSAAVLRQCTYTTGKVGVFHILHDSYYSAYDELPSFPKLLLMGMCGGAVGSFIGNPAEVALIRMAADGRLPKEKRRNYKNVFHAIRRMYHEEGVLTLWRGCGASILRSSIISGSQLSTYALTRDSLKPTLGEGTYLRFLASTFSGAVTTIVTMPVDNIKTKIQNAQGKLKPVDIFANTLKNDGVLALWQGMLPMFLKMAPQNLLVFFMFEHMQDLYRKMFYPHLTRKLICEHCR